MIKLVLASLLAFALTACNSAIDPSTASTQISFERYNGSDYDLFIMNPDGSGVAPLVLSPGDDRHASWSPDGSWFVFSSTRSGDEEVYVAKANGSGIANLTRNPGRDHYP